MDKLVAARFGLSRRAAMDAIRNGRVDLAGVVCDEPGRMVDGASELRYEPSRPKARVVAGRPRVLYEDRHVVILDKPAGLLTLPTAQHERDTLLSRVERYLRLRYGGQPFVGVIHRLDKDTTGAIAMARSPQSQRAFQELFKRHVAERRYLAVVEGSPERSSGVIDRALISDRDSLRRRIAEEGESGRHAITRYEVIERFGSIAALVTCWLETGRTHQIRIHMASIGHAVVGDAVYRGRRRKKGAWRIRRQALHAETLGFEHPITGERVAVEAPVPDDLTRLISELRSAARRFGDGTARPRG